MKLTFWTIFQTFLVQFLMLLFLKGYFPVSQYGTMVIDPPRKVQNVTIDPASFYQPQIDRLVVVVIDGLRHDFHTAENMPFLYEKMHCMLNMKAEAPTVTLPRIKALLTGSVPQYIDIVLNLGATSKIEDSFIHRAATRGKKMLFYGDNTWLSMFPQQFSRSEGTTSFFVNDFTEVDNNVTRHIARELHNHDWDMMFLHYLGLDHIGHVRGPFSSLVQPKLREMDKVVKDIILATHTWEEKTLLLVTGDHGMKDSGGHGGTTYSETHVPLIIWHNKLRVNCSKKLTQDEIPQTDVANSLSALFGIAMPATSVGTFLPFLFAPENSTQLLYIAYYNSLILRRNANNCENLLTLADRNFAEALRRQDFQGLHAQEAYAQYHHCLKRMSEHLVATSVKEDVNVLLFAFAASVNALIGIVYVNYAFSRSTRLDHFSHILNAVSGAIFILVYYYFECVESRYVLIIMLGQVAIFIENLRSFMSIIELKCCKTYFWNSLPVLLHASLLLASSYIEFEEEIFYFLLNTTFTLIAVCVFQSKKKVTLVTVMPWAGVEMIRVARGINTHWLLRDENIATLKLLHLFALLATYLTFRHYFLSKPRRFLIHQPIILSLIFIYKFHYERSPTFAQFIWVLIGSQLFRISSGIQEGSSRLLNLFVLVVVFLLRAHNTILVPSMIICSRILVGNVRSPFFLTLWHVYLGYAFFFLQGHSNSIASIDLAPGYTGLSTYIPTIVGLLTALHCYAFQCLGMLLVCCKTSLPPFYVFRINITVRVIMLIVIYGVALFQRRHLFIWSVFAPKLLIECAHTFFLSLQIMLYFTCTLFKMLWLKNV